MIQELPRWLVRAKQEDQLLGRGWVIHLLDKEYFENEEYSEAFAEEQIRFWQELFTQYDAHVIEKDKKEKKEKSKPLQYKEAVFELLCQHKEKLSNMTDEEFKKLQEEIEDLTIKFDEGSIFKSAPNLIKMLIRYNEQNAKDYIKDMRLTKEDEELLSEFGQYTIEALIVHVLSVVFHNHECWSMIRVASLVERLEYHVRTQAVLLRRRRCKQAPATGEGIEDRTSDTEIKKSKLEKDYPFGSALIRFMEERGLVTLVHDLEGNKRVRKKGGSYYLPSHLYAICNFDVSLLPIKLNLPMVYPPKKWESVCQKPRTLSDLTGGYLSGPTGDLYDRYRLLSSGNLENSYIDISGEGNAERLCKTMSSLQEQAFKINKEWLNCLQDNEHELTLYGFLMPKYLASIDIKAIIPILRDCHMKYPVVKNFFSFTDLVNQLSKNIQRARYEQLIIKLAKAYEGYEFDLPAFLDFRGRIYRCGILHFHERDLARSLLFFSDKKTKNAPSPWDREKLTTVSAAAGFHFKAHNSATAAFDWFVDQFPYNNEDAFVLALEAKRPFQFLATVLGLLTDRENVFKCMPIVQDASASAYQIMSYFLLDETMAERTNLIPSSDDEIKDVYSFILDDVKEYGPKNLTKELKDPKVFRFLTRNIVKSIYMPIVYGKTPHSTAADLEKSLSHYITKTESWALANICFDFWKSKFPSMECLIRLCRNTGWFSSARDRPVFYRVPSFTTVQDYMKMVPIKLWISSSAHKKRHQVTLRVSSEKRDRKKSEVSTFVNFIHQKDAQIAMSVVDEMLSIGAPIYTVHDNFITTASYSKYVPLFYATTFRNMGPPLSIVNELIYLNLIKPIAMWESNGPTEGSFARVVIPEKTLRCYLTASVPKDITKKQKAVWDQRIEKIVSDYYSYARNVCGGSLSPDPRASFEAHEKKWEKFKSKLRKRGGSYHYYCVHY